jgi:hypothetical protein
VVQAILGVRRMPSAMTLTRYFGGLVRSQIEHLSEVLGQFVLRRLRAPALGAVLDLDSTVFERYGRQQGNLKGYNPRQHGRPSHHPLLAMLAEAKVVVHAWLRSGQYRQCPWGQGVFSRDLGQAAGGFSALCGARGLGLLGH